MRAAPVIAVVASLLHCSCDRGDQGFSPHSGLPDGSASDTDTDGDTDADGDTDTGTGDDCPEGWQDNDDDGTCLPGCEASGLQCAAHAHCDDSSGHVTCACDGGYQDHDDDGSCLPTCATAALDCGDGAHCEDLSGVAACACDPGFQDNDEDGSCLPDCAMAVIDCGDHGACDDSGGGAACACDAGYAGAACDECGFGHQDNDGDGTCLPSCLLSGLDCEGNSHCDDTSGEALCACDAGYDGELCDACAPDFQDNDHDGSCRPGCDLAGDVCDGPGSCDDASGEALCACDPGYQDNDDDGTCNPDCATAAPACDPGESCEDWLGIAHCACPLGTAGDGCADCAPGFAPGPGGCEPVREWTIILYMNADNNLEEEGLSDLDELASVGSSDEVALVALFDAYTLGARTLYIAPGEAVVVDDHGELDLGDWRTLWQFGAFAVRSYPAKRYALVLWDHGDGWRDGADGPAFKAFSGDLHGTAAGISVAGGKLAAALAGAVAAREGAPLDIVGFDACLMGTWEVAAAVAPFAAVFVASSEKVPAAGWPYTDILSALVSDPDIDAAGFATGIVSAYGAASVLHQTMAATDLAALGGLSTAVSGLADALLAEPASFDALEVARAAAQGFSDPGQRDLSDLAGVLAVMENLDENAAAAALAVEDAVDDAVIESFAQESHPGSHGLSIYLPASGSGLDSAYRGDHAAWSADTAWDDLLAAFVSGE